MAASLKVMVTLMGVLFGFLTMGAKSTPNTSINHWRCNKNSYSATDPYAGNVEYVLAALASVTPNAGYNYYTQSPSSTSICYGHGICALQLSYNDCADCLTAAADSVKEICAAKIGGTVEMVDCTIRYENYSFS